MRIETFNAAATLPETEWVLETMTVTDGLSHLQGLAEIEVIEDKIVPLPPPQGGADELYAHRIIRGTVMQRLAMWDQRSGYFGQELFLGGVQLPEENKRYQANRTSINYDDSSNIMTLTLLEQIHEPLDPD